MDYCVGWVNMSDLLLRAKDVWQQYGMMPFTEWIVEISQLASESRLGIVRFARAIDRQPAEVLAILKLASLESEDLELIAQQIPPRTTWLTLADADSDGIKACLDALSRRPPGVAPFTIVEEYLKTSAESSTWDGVLALPASVLDHFVKLEVEYKCLNSKARGAFSSFAKKKKQGSSFTPPQAQYLANILMQLVDGGVISSDGKRKDLDKCVQVMKALGR